VIGKISGETVVTKISGEAVKISGETVFSKISGEIVGIEVPTVGRARPPLTCTSDSGGVALLSGDVVSMTLKALTTNSGDIYVGFDSEPPYSGYGFLLQAGETIILAIDNFNKIRVFAQSSGDKLTYIGVK
jgi:hypothetical protein